MSLHIRLFYYNNSWYAIDASKYSTDNATSAALSAAFKIGIDWRKMSWTSNYVLYPFSNGDTDSTKYTIYVDGDNGKIRLDYLKSSMQNTITNLDAILNILSVGKTSNPDVKIAYNTFDSKIETYNLNFTSASSFNGTATFGNLTTAGGTHTDYALSTDPVNHSADDFKWEESTTKYAILITDGAPQNWHCYR